jgi:hypothetical protein
MLNHSTTHRRERLLPIVGAPSFGGSELDGRQHACSVEEIRNEVNYFGRTSRVRFDRRTNKLDKYHGDGVRRMGGTAADAAEMDLAGERRRRSADGESGRAPG